MAKLEHSGLYPMLRIGKLTDYALLIMSQIAKVPDAILSAPLLADQLNLRTPTVSKILKILADAELVNSIRGAEGGYHLSRAPETITVADIIAAMEGALAMTECCERPQLCALDAQCTMRENWIKINTLVIEVLKKISLKDMLTPLNLVRLING